MASKETLPGTNGKNRALGYKGMHTVLPLPDRQRGHCCKAANISCSRMTQAGGFAEFL